MYVRLILNDFKRSKTISLTIALFIATAAMLVSLAAILIITLTGSIDELMATAETPHFMQMHAGEIDKARLVDFARESDLVEDYQLVEFLNVDGSDILIGTDSLSSSIQDNGLTYQNHNFDFLLDLEGEVITPADGQIYLPISFLKEKKAEIGDRALIGGIALKVAGFLRDSQMNSSLASSKRFLVSEKDYSTIKEATGEVEYLIEFRLKSLDSLGDFENSYMEGGLEANGPTITYSLFRLLNALSDGLMIALILLVSILIVLIAFMCIRFSLLTKIEEDYTEIGVMKALGLRIADMKKIYLAKYVLVSLSGGLLGFAMSRILQNFLLANIRLYMGESGNAHRALVFGIAGVFLICLTILFYVNRVLSLFRKISPSEAIRFGYSEGKAVKSKALRLSRNRHFDTNLFLGIKDVYSRKKLYLTMITVFIISAFIAVVPSNLHKTVTSKDFVSYMGVGVNDIRFDIQQTGGIGEKSRQIASHLESDSAVSEFSVLTTKSYRMHEADGSMKNIKIELGDHSVFPLQYSAGNAPESEYEIALSNIYADELGRKVGESITLSVRGEKRDLVVSGIYSDITNGGRTAKGAFADDSAEIMWCVIGVNLHDPEIIDGKVRELAEEFPYAKVSNIEDFVSQTFGSTIDSVGSASAASLAIALLVSFLITVLFMKMLVAKDAHESAVAKSFGYTNRDLRLQYISRSFAVLIPGIAIGIILANTAGEQLAGLMISSFGASTFRFVIDPVSSYIAVPLLLAAAVLSATFLGTIDIGKILISEHIKE